MSKQQQPMPLLVIEATGELVKSNFDDFNAAATEWLESINRNLRTDEDFEQASEDAKKAKETEDLLTETHRRILEQAESVNAELAKITALSERMRKARLFLTNQIDKAKSEQRAKLIDAGLALIQCDASVRETFRKAIEDAAKGKRTLDTMQESIRIAANIANDKIGRAKRMLDDFEKANGNTMTADRARLEITDPASLEPELARRLERSQAAERERKLREEAARMVAEAKAREDAAKMAAQMAASASQPVPGPSAKSDPATVTDMPWDGGEKQPVAEQPEMTAGEEWKAFKSVLAEAFTTVRMARGRLVHAENKAMAEAFATACGDALERIEKGGAK